MAKQRPSKKGRTRKRAEQKAKARKYTEDKKQDLLRRMREREEKRE